MQDLPKKRLTPQQARQKMESFCAYRERCHKEVKDKLYGYGLYPSEVDQIVVYLIEQNFLNEERFAMAYVSGKFRIKGWGRQRIERELKLRQISPYLIRKAMEQIDGDEYESTLKKLAEKKWKLMTERDSLKKRQKLMRFLVSKGYKLNEVTELIRNWK